MMARSRQEGGLVAATAMYSRMFFYFTPFCFDILSGRGFQFV
jgi:hypothetical protein